MVGKIILWVLLALLALLVIALLIPVKVRFRYEDGEPFLAVRYGPVKLQVLPAKEKPEGEEKKKKPPKKKKAEKPKQAKKNRINMDQILYALEKLPPILGRALRRTGRSIRFEPMKVHLLVAGSNPADAALLYGQLEAALSAGLPTLHRVMRIRDQDIRLFLDFNEQRPDAIADVGVALRPGSLVWIALRAGGSLLKWFVGFRKLASPPPADTEESSDVGSKEQSKVGSNHEAA